MQSPFVELLTPKQASLTIDADLEKFQERCATIVACDCGVSIPDNPLGHPHFTAPEVLAYQQAGLQPDRLLIHLNTFHRKSDLDAILDQSAGLGITRLLCVSGDGGPRLTKLEPADLNMDGNTVTSIELLRYIHTRHRDHFTCGVAFNPYEPPQEEMDKLRRKIDAGAKFVVTQPVMADLSNVQALANFRVPVWIGAWMSKRIELFYQCIGREPDVSRAPFDPYQMLKRVRTIYPDFGLYLAVLNFKQDWCGLLREL